jgi:hypothetical protein
MRNQSPVLLAEKQLHNVRTTLCKREQRYVEARCQGMPPAPSARVAGWTDDSKCRELEMDVRIRTAIDASNKVLGLKQQLTREDVLAGLYEATQMAATATEMVAAWREIGKVIGAYDAQKVDIRISDREQLRDLSDEDLRSQLEGTVIEGEYSLIEFDDSEDDADIPTEPPEGYES